jgi:hypothetical protein
VRGDEGQEVEALFFDETSIAIPNNDNGFGMKILEDGRKIIGVFANGKINGYGVCYYSNSEKYIGEFKNDNRHGEGLLISRTETVNGIWNDDRLIGTNIKPLFGCRVGNCGNGGGVRIYDDFTLYDGYFTNNKAEGEGVCYYGDGDVFVGYWKGHNFDGQGVFYYKDGRKDSGYWENGRLLNAYELPNFQAGVALNTAARGDEYSTSIEAFAAEPAMRTVETKTTVGKTAVIGKIWAVVIGVANYRASTIQPLNFPDDDAYRFHSFLKSPEGGAIKDEQIKLLIDGNATRVNIVKSLIEFSEQATPEDVFIFYFSGHGLPGAFLPIDSDGIKNQLKYKELLAILKTSKAKSKIIIADACHSGSLMNFKGEKNLAYSTDNYYDAIHKSQGGLVLLMSSKAEETSIENNGLRQGVFSYYLIKGLKGAANTNSDNLIRINELFDYVKSNVSFYTNDYQTPMIYGDGAIDHPIGFIRED